MRYTITWPSHAAPLPVPCARLSNLGSALCPLPRQYSETRDFKQLDLVICILHTESVLNLRRIGVCFEHACGYHLSNQGIICQIRVKTDIGGIICHLRVWSIIWGYNLSNGGMIYHVAGTISQMWVQSVKSGHILSFGGMICQVLGYGVSFAGMICHLGV